MKRIITLVAALAVAATMFAVVAYGSSSRASATTVKVTAKDTFRFVLTRKSAPHGKVTFKVTNKGRIRHDFKIAGKKTKLLGHNKTATLTVTLKKGKKYTYLCTVPGHAAAGMKGTFKAT
jgi:plastocyanin